MSSQEIRGLLHHYTLEVEQHGQWIHSNLPEPDPNWHHIDNADHGHFLQAGSVTNYPTLQWEKLSDGTYLLYMLSFRA